VLFLNLQPNVEDAMNRKQQLAMLKQKRDAFITAYGDAQLKRAEKVRVIKEFTSMITFLDEDLKPVVQLSRPKQVNNVEMPVLNTVQAPKANVTKAKAVKIEHAEPLPNIPKRYNTAVREPVIVESKNLDSEYDNIVPVKYQRIK